MSVGQIDMRLAHHLLRHPSGVWHFRLIVPADLQGLLGRRVIKKSLGTRDPVVARAWAYALGAQYAQAFAAARGRPRRAQSSLMKVSLRSTSRTDRKQKHKDGVSLSAP